MGEDGVVVDEVGRVWVKMEGGGRSGKGVGEDGVAVGCVLHV